MHIPMIYILFDRMSIRCTQVYIKCITYFENVGADPFKEFFRFGISSIKGGLLIIISSNVCTMYISIEHS